MITPEVMQSVDDVCDWLDYDVVCCTTVLESIKKLNRAQIRLRAKNWANYCNSLNGNDNKEDTVALEKCVIDLALETVSMLQPSIVMNGYVRQSLTTLKEELGKMNG